MPRTSWSTRFQRSQLSHTKHDTRLLSCDWLFQIVRLLTVAVVVAAAITTSLRRLAQSRCTIHRVVMLVQRKSVALIHRPVHRRCRCRTRAVSIRLRILLRRLQRRNKRNVDTIGWVRLATVCRRPSRRLVSIASGIALISALLRSVAVGRRSLLRRFRRRKRQSGQRETPLSAHQFKRFFLLIVSDADDAPIADRGQLKIRVRGLTRCFFNQIVAAGGRVGVQFRAELGASNRMATGDVSAGRFHLSLAAGGQQRPMKTRTNERVRKMALLADRSGNIGLHVAHDARRRHVLQTDGAIRQRH